MSEMPLARLQVLLRDLFQYDYADLDFGIYRLLRLKRGEVETFLTEQLPRRVDEVFMATLSLFGRIAVNHGTNRRYPAVAEGGKHR
jgi:hypothetical protein